MVSPAILIRALRLPFITVSVIPFCFGSFALPGHFNRLNFTLGLIAVTMTHLASNLLNDYADSRSGADWYDRNFYGYFGGSKLIQNNILSEGFYLKSALALIIVAFAAVLTLAFSLRNISVVALYLIILLLGISYSEKPFMLSYNGFGEAVVFVLFGPAVVMGGYFIQADVFPDMRSLFISLPFGFLTAAVLFANEVPDFPEDIKARKLTLVSLVGPERSYILYYGLIVLAFFSISIGVVFGYLSAYAFTAFLFIFIAMKSTKILKEYPHDKIRLIGSSKLTVLLHFLVSLTLVLSEII